MRSTTPTTIIPERRSDRGEIARLHPVDPRGAKAFYDHVDPGDVFEVVP
ncbi:hypothetical protein [Nocardia mikamii]|nr:hypothetical protein [Nocardia mikamii]